MDLIKLDDKEPKTLHEDLSFPGVYSETLIETEEWQKCMKKMQSSAHLPTYEEVATHTESYIKVPTYADCRPVFTSNVGSSLLGDETLKRKPLEEETIDTVQSSEITAALTGTYHLEKKNLTINELPADNSVAARESSVQGTSSVSETSISSSTIDLNAVPSKPILHCYRRPTRKGLRPRKSVRFPFTEPKVVLDEHRLVITELELGDDK